MCNFLTYLNRTNHEVSKLTYKYGNEDQNKRCNDQFKGKGSSGGYLTEFNKYTSRNYDNWFYLNFLGDFNETNSNSDPCSSPCTSPSTFSNWKCKRKSECIPSTVNKCEYHVSNVVGCHCM